MSVNQAIGIHQVVAGLLVDGDKVLSATVLPVDVGIQVFGTFRGAHVEENEAPSVALVRELHEELGIVIPEPADPAFAHLQQPDFDCRIWIVREWIGIPHIASDEHNDMEWRPPGATEGLSLAVESYRPLLQRAVSGIEG